MIEDELDYDPDDHSDWEFERDGLGWWASQGRAGYSDPYEWWENYERIRAGR